MTPPPDQQLEKLVDEVLQNHISRELENFLLEVKDGNTIKCSKEFLTKIDKLINRGLDRKDAKCGCLGFTLLQKCGKNLSLPGSQGFAGLVTYGLVKKWFVKSRQLWIDEGQQRDEALIVLAEDFFDLSMIVHGASKEGMCQITESLLYPIGQLAGDPRIHIMIQKEAIRKLNIILDKIPADLKKEKRILSSQEASDIMNTLAGRILDCGDYDLQIAFMEALCRMTTQSHRKEMADRWFTMEYVACAFNKIQDSEFETDCRKFLNLINGMQGEKRRVFSYPCLEAYLDKHELLMPSDEKLEDFWIDFNLGSQSLSFYFSVADDNAEGDQWDTIFIPENEVEGFAVTEESQRLVLRLRLSEPVSVSGVEGSNLIIYFSTSLDILQAACRVYGLNKNKCLVDKNGTSVVKTTDNFIMEGGSQAFVPESQASTIDEIDRQRNDSSCLLPPPPASSQMVTPARSRVSESCTYITSSGRGSRSGISPFTVVKQSITPGKSKLKPALEMIRSCERQAQPILGQLRTSTTSSSASTPALSKIEKDAFLESKDSKRGTRTVAEKYRRNIPVDKVVEMLQADHEEEEEPLDQSFVPDSQGTIRTEKSILSHWTKTSVSEMLIPVRRNFNKDPSKPEAFPSAVRQDQTSTTKRALTPGSCPISQQHLHTQLTQRLQEVLKERNKRNGSVERGGANSQSRFQSRGSEECGRQTGSASTETQGQEIRQGQAKKKSYAVNSCGSEPVLFKDTEKPTLTRGLKERPTPNANVQVSGFITTKEKRDAEVAGSMGKLISSHYDSNNTCTAKTTVQNNRARWAPPVINRSLFDKSWLPSAKRGAIEAPGLTKSDSSSNKPSVLQGEDVFAFGADTPMNIGGMAKKSLETSATDSSAIHDSWAIPSTLKKDPPTGKKRRHVRKHLFSDTDTDAAMTDVSWLAASSRRPKPKVTDYTRQPPVKSKAPETDESLILPPPTPKPVKEKTKPMKKLREKAKAEKPAAAIGLSKEAIGPRKAVPVPGKKSPIPRTESDLSKTALGDGRRPRRAAAATAKSYRELDSDDSQAESEAEQPPCPKKNSRSKSETRDNTVLQEATKWKNDKLAPAKKQINVLKNSWVARLGSFSPSPPPIEKLRSAERSVALAVSPLLSPVGTLPASPIGACPPSPISDLPKRSTRSSGKGGFQPSSFYSIDKKSDTVKLPDLPSAPCLPLMPSLPSPLTLCPKGQKPVLPTVKQSSAKELSPISRPISPAQSMFSLCSQPVLTSTALEKSLLPSLQTQFSATPGDMISQSLHFDSDRESLVSRVTLSQSSSKSVMSTTEVEISSVALAMTNKLEKTPASNIVQKPDQQKYLSSGPSRKRHNTTSCSDSEGGIDEEGAVDEEDKKGKQSTGLSAKMRPRKLFKSMAKSAQVQNLKENSILEKDENNEGNRGQGAISGPSKAPQKGYNLIQRESMSSQESVIDVSPEGEVSRVVSSHTVSSSHWEAEVEGEMEMELPDIGPTPQDMGAMCRQFSIELKRKFQNRSRRMELYNKQSLKTVQQHVSSISLQVSQYRSQKLEQVRKILMTEINNLEKDESTLKNMEKECLAYWRKQSLGFRSCQEGEIKRLQTLKNAFQNNMCHSLEYEEKIFSSQMCLMRKDMKSVQDRLFKEMQEEEILSVRRGLHTLFIPDGPRF